MEAAFFDLDKTVIARASMVAFGRPLYHEGLISRTTVLRALYGQLVYMHLGASEQKLARIRDSVLALTRGWERDRIQQIVRETLEETIEPISYAEALEEIELHHREGRKVYIVSASPEEIVAPLVDYLGADGAIASRPRVDETGRYTGSMDFYAYGPYKAEAMRDLAEKEGIDLSRSWSYSDSYTDLPMLEAVGRPVAVNPDRVLSRLAKEREWEVRQWVRTVKLHERRTAAGAPTFAAAAVAAGAAGVAVWWQLTRRDRDQALSPERAARLAAIARQAGGVALSLGAEAARGAATGLGAAATAGRAVGTASGRAVGAAAAELSRRAGGGPPPLRDRPARRGARPSSWAARLPGPIRPGA